MLPTARVPTTLYTDSDARNWLTIYHCLLSPTKLGDLEIVFPSESAQLEFFLRFGHYRCAQSTI
jgi:hypothetical protein